MSFFAQKVSDGYGGYTYNPTAAGYAALVIILILLLILIGMIKGKSGSEKKISTKQITFSCLDYVIKSGPSVKWCKFAPLLSVVH